MREDPALSFSGVTKSYGRGGEHLVVLDHVDLSVGGGEVVALTGPSGSGKSTALHLAAGLDVAEAGSVTVCGVAVASLSTAARAALRRGSVGLVFQAFHLLAHLTVRENVALPGLLAAAGSLRPVWARADELVAALGLEEQADQRAGTLSGGQAQRVAIARAVFGRPPLLLADEPTGNLDAEAGRVVVDLLWREAAEHGAALVVATHDPEVAARADRRVAVGGGRLLEHTP